MAGSRSSNVLFVEGSDDKFVIVHLMQRLCPWLDADARRWCGDFHIDTSNDDEALARFSSSLKSATGRYGLVLDADESPGKQVAERWKAIRDALGRHGISMPESPPSEGWLGRVEPGPTRVSLGPRLGVWLMPDNARNGALEAFLEPLVPSGDTSWSYATSVAAEARQLHGAPFRPHHEGKARLHTWLAWRTEPGRPYGRALVCGDLCPEEDPVAARFKDWFLSLFELSGPS